MRNGLGYLAFGASSRVVPPLERSYSKTNTGTIVAFI